MGSAMIKGWENSSFRLHVLELNKPDNNVVQFYQVDEYQKFFENIDIVFIAVRPSAWPQVKLLLENNDLTKVSIMAGITLAQLSEVPGPWFRVMPNLPVEVGLGCLALFGTANATNALESLLSKLGKVITLKQESDMHAFTALAGSGPAWLWHYASEWVKVAEKLGFDQSQAQTIVQQTIRGAATISEEKDFTKLCNSVASKGGTTESGLQFISLGLEAAIMAAVQRSKELAQE